MTTTLVTAGTGTALAPATRAMTDLIAVTYGALEPIGGSHNRFALSAARSPSADQRRALAARRQDIAGALFGCDPDTVLRAVSTMRVSLASKAFDRQAQELLRDTFVAVLIQFPAEVVERAAILFAGGAEGDGVYAPQPAEVAAVCRRLVGAVRAEAHRIDAILSAEVLPPITDADREAGAARAAQLGADMRAKAEVTRDLDMRRPVVTEAERTAALALLNDLAERKRRNEARDAEVAA